MIKLIQGDCLEVMATLEENSVDTIITDPPYGLEFMGKDWDKLGGDAGMSKPGIGERAISWPAYGGDLYGGANPTCAICSGRKRGKRRCSCETPDWRVKGEKVRAFNTGLAQQEWHYNWAVAALRVAKPGATMLCFGGDRTHHRLMVAIEDAGWEIRTCIYWVFGSGFPKSHNISKAIGRMVPPSDPAEVVGHVGGIDTGLPASLVGASIGTEAIAMPLAGIPTDGADRLGLHSSRSSLGGAGKVERSVEQASGQSDPEMFGAFGVTGFAEGDEVVHSVGLVEKQPESLGDQMMSGEPLGCTTIGTSPSVADDLCRDGGPIVPLVGISSPTPSGVPAATEPAAVIDSHASPRAVDGLGRFSGNGLTTGATDESVCLHDSDYTTKRQALQAEWDGWGTALKPAAEIIVVAMKPRDGTFANNALTWGVAGLNIDGGRVGTGDNLGGGMVSMGRPKVSEGWDRPWMHDPHVTEPKKAESAAKVAHAESLGRWPANLVHDGSDEVMSCFPNKKAGVAVRHNVGHSKSANINYATGSRDAEMREDVGYGDSGSVARFFYCAKSSRSERNLGLDGTRTIKYNIPKSIGGILCKDVSMALVESLRKATSELTVQWLIGESGASIMGLCPEDSLSTTLTEISKITESRILHLLMQQLTNESTVDANCETVCGGSLVASAEDLSQSIKNSGTCQRKDTLFTEDVKCVISELLLKIRDEGNWQERTNIHSTVKPLALMRYLAKLTATPTGGVVLDPFMGSGTTGMAAVYEGRDFIGIELEPEYFEIATARIQYALDEADKSHQIEMVLP